MSGVDARQQGLRLAASTTEKVEAQSVNGGVWSRQRVGGDDL